MLEYSIEKRVPNFAMGYRNEGLKSSGYYSKFLLIIQVLKDQVSTLVVLTLRRLMHQWRI